MGLKLLKWFHWLVRSNTLEPPWEYYGRKIPAGFKRMLNPFTL